MLKKSLEKEVQLSAKLVDKKQKRTEIINAAFVVFAKVGYKDARIKDIASEAGIGKGTIYEYFSSKNELLDAVFEIMMLEYIDVFEKYKNTQKKPIEKLKSLINVFGDMIEKADEELMEIFIEFWSLCLRDEKKKAKFKKIYEKIRGIVENVLLEGIEDKSLKKHDTKSISAAVIGIPDACIFQYMIDKEFYDYKKTISTIIEAIIDGLRNE